MNLLIICIFAVACISIMPATIQGAKNTMDRKKKIDEIPRALPSSSNVKKGEKYENFARNKRASKKDSSGVAEDVPLKTGISSLGAGGASVPAVASAAAVGVNVGSGVVGAAGGSSVTGGVSGAGGGKRGKNKKNNKSPTEISSASSSSQQGAGAGPILKRPSKGKTHTHQKQQRLREKSPPKTHQQFAYPQNAKNTKKDNTKVLDSGKISSACRYSKSAWTDCDAKTNTRKRTLALRKGDNSCDPTKIIERKCKKSCRYDKGTWSECENGQMTRSDTLKSTSDESCKATRIINKNCNPGKSDRKKDRKKVARKGRA